MPKPKATDAELLAAYEKFEQNASRVARHFKLSSGTVRDRINSLQKSKGQRSEEKLRRLECLDKLLEERGIDPSEIRIDGGRISHSEVGMKVKQPDGTHKVVVTPLKHTQIVFAPKWESGPEWPVIEPAPQRPLQFDKDVPVAIKRGLRRVLIVPDVQIGYFRNLVTGELEPFHDLKAIDALMQLIVQFKPHEIVILGDFLDCTSISKWLQIAEFQLTLQPAIIFGYEMLVMIRQLVGPHCKIHYLAGNHERRMAEFIARNAIAAYGLRPGHDPKGWPALSIPRLLNLDQLDIKYSDEYPGGQVWLTKKLVCRHQPTTKKQDLRASEISGHHPQYSANGHTVHYHDGPETYYQFTIPGLMHITDNLSDPTRLVRTSVASDGTKLNWSQGVGVVYIEDEDHFKVDVAPIRDGRMIFENQVFQGRLPRKDGKLRAM